jgi:solute carrier family 35 protein E4
MAPKEAANSMVGTLFAVASWFILNIAVGSTTKWIFLYGQICTEETPGSEEGTTCKAFKYPLTITIIHMVFSWVMCFVQLNFISAPKKRRVLSIKEQLEKVAPLSICFSLSVACGNLALKYIFPSFNQMLGSMTPLVTVAIAVFFQAKRYNFWTWVSIPVICGGLAMCSVKEVNFNVWGLFFAVSATLLRALKTIVQGKLLQGGDKMDSVTLLFYMAPWAALFLASLSAFSEGLEPLVEVVHGLMGANSAGQKLTGGPMLLLMLLVSGLNACLLNVANFSVTSYTSPLTMQVLGNVKNCMSIIISVAIFKNDLLPAQAVGVATCLAGVYLYNSRGGVVKESDKKCS